MEPSESKWETDEPSYLEKTVSEIDNHEFGFYLHLKEIVWDYEENKEEAIKQAIKNNQGKFCLIKDYHYSWFIQGFVFPLGESTYKVKTKDEEKILYYNDLNKILIFDVKPSQAFYEKLADNIIKNFKRKIKKN